MSFIISNHVKFVFNLNLPSKVATNCVTLFEFKIYTGIKQLKKKKKKKTYDFRSACSQIIKGFLCKKNPKQTNKQALQIYVM